MPAEPIIGAAAVHDLLMSWRRALHGSELGPAIPVHAGAGAPTSQTAVTQTTTGGNPAGGR